MIALRMLYRLPVSFQDLFYEPQLSLLFVSRLLKKYGCIAKCGTDLALAICTGPGLGFDNISKFPNECLEVSVLIQNQRLIEESFVHAVGQAPACHPSYTELPRYLFDAVALASDSFNRKLGLFLEQLLHAPRADPQSGNDIRYADWITYNLYQQFLLSKVVARDSMGLYSSFRLLRQCKGEDIITTADGTLVLKSTKDVIVHIVRGLADKYAKNVRSKLKEFWPHKLGPSYFLYSGQVPLLKPPIEI